MKQIRRYFLRFIALAVLSVPVVAIVADQGEPAASGRGSTPDTSEGRYPAPRDAGVFTGSPVGSASPAPGPSPQPTASRPGVDGLLSEPASEGPDDVGSLRPDGQARPESAPSGGLDPAPSQRPTPSPTGGGQEDPRPTPTSEPPHTEQPQPPASPEPSVQPTPKPPPTLEPTPKPTVTPKPPQPPTPPEEQPEEPDDGSLVCLDVLGVEICLL